jgi:hypothetical protein
MVIVMVVVGRKRQGLSHDPPLDCALFSFPENLVPTLAAYAAAARTFDAIGMAVAPAP